MIGTDDVIRPMLCLAVDAADVLAHDAEHDELDPADEQDDADEGGVASDRIAVEQRAHENKEHIEKCRSRAKHPEHRGEAQRQLRERGQPIQSQSTKLQIVPLRFTDRPWRPVEYDFFFTEANPAE